MRGIAAGNYRLVAGRPGFETVTRHITVKARDDKKVVLLTPVVETMRRAAAARRAAVVAAGASAPAQARPEPAGGAGGSRLGTGRPPVVRVQRGHLRGRVVDAQTRRPVAGASVLAAGARAAFTDRHGTFHVENLPTGSTTVRVTRPGYLVLERVVSISGGRTLTVDVSLRPIPRLRC